MIWEIVIAVSLAGLLVGFLGGRFLGGRKYAHKCLTRMAADAHKLMLYQPFVDDENGEDCMDDRVRYVVHYVRDHCQLGHMSWGHFKAAVKEQDKKNGK